MDGAGVPPELSDTLEDYGGLEGLERYRPDPDAMKRLERVYSLLSSRSRIEVLFFLNFAPMTPGMLCTVTGMAPNLLSFHLKKLKNAGIIEARRNGKFMVYSITEMGKSLSGPLAR